MRSIARSFVSTSSVAAAIPFDCRRCAAREISPRLTSAITSRTSAWRSCSSPLVAPWDRAHVAVCLVAAACALCNKFADSPRCAWARSMPKAFDISARAARLAAPQLLPPRSALAIRRLASAVVHSSMRGKRSGGHSPGCVTGESGTHVAALLAAQSKVAAMSSLNACACSLGMRLCTCRSFTAKVSRSTSARQ